MSEPLARASGLCDLSAYGAICQKIFKGASEDGCEVLQSLLHDY